MGDLLVVFVGKDAHALAADVTWAGVADVAVVFALVWFAWLNGSLYHELHGGDDGRSRTRIFVQMGLLVILAVYAGHAAQDSADGRGFAIVYVLLLALSLAAPVTTMEAHPGRRLVPGILVGVASVAPLPGALRPTPWVLALGLPVARFVPWTDAFVRHARLGRSMVEE